MVTQDVTNLKLGYGALDYIVKIVHKLDVELKFQSVQMDRMDDKLKEHDAKFATIEKLLKKIAAHFDIK